MSKGIEWLECICKSLNKTRIFKSKTDKTAVTNDDRVPRGSRSLAKDVNSLKYNQ
jgi:hypothetical protein